MRSFLTILESLTFSLLFHWAYSASEFKDRADRYMQNQQAPRLGTWRAVCDAIDLSDIANAIWVALGFAWQSLAHWWKGSSADNSASRGPLGVAVGMVVAAAGKGRGSKTTGDHRRELSPFDDSMATTVPSMPRPARGSMTGRTRTFDGHDDLGMPMARDEQRTEYEASRGGRSRESSLSDWSSCRR